MHRDVQISDVQVDAARLLRPTGDELRRWAATRRTFVSSVMDLRDERRAAIDGIGDTGAEAVAWELITPRPVAPEDAWLDGVATSDSIVLLLGTGYGRRRATGFSATHAEFNRAEELGLDRWVFVDARVDPGTRDGYLHTWMAELAERYSYATFRDEAELRAAVSRAIADLARYRLYTWHKVGNLVIRADEANLVAPSAAWTAGQGSLQATGRISDPEIRAALAEIHAQGRPVPLVVHGQLFEATLVELEERAARGDQGYRAAYRLNPTRTSDSLLWMTMSEGGREWRPEDLVDLTVRELAGLGAPERPRMLSPHAAIDWHESAMSRLNTARPVAPAPSSSTSLGLQPRHAPGENDAGDLQSIARQAAAESRGLRLQATILAVVIPALFGYLLVANRASSRSSGTWPTTMRRSAVSRPRWGTSW